MVLGGREHLILEVSIMVPVTPGSPIRVGQVVLLGATVVLEAEGSRDTVRCPMCHTLSHQVHDRYSRRPLDLPWRGSVVRFHLMVRRFRCPNRVCSRANLRILVPPSLGLPDALPTPPPCSSGWPAQPSDEFPSWTIARVVSWFTPSSVASTRSDLPAA